MNAENMILDLVRKSLSETNDLVYLPKTAFYNEGWLLRLALEEFYKWPLKELNPKDFGTGWLSEGLLQPPFKKEGSTHVDGIMGDFVKRPKTKGGLMLAEGATQLVVFEAKLFSWFSKSIANAPGYNQVARTVACITNLFCIRNTHNIQNEIQLFENRLGLILLLPEQVKKERDISITSLVCKDNIKKIILERISTSDNLRNQPQDVFKDIMNAVVNHLKIEVISWETITEELTWLRPYYDKCLIYNKG